MIRKSLQYSIRALLLLIPTTIAVYQHEDKTASKLMVCYYASSTYLPITQVPADLCTHIIYAFAKVTPAGIEPIQQGDLQKYKILVQLKQKNPNLKILLSLQSGFPSVVSKGSEATMKSFSQSAVKFLSSNGFDGVDLDWEFPSASEKDNYMQFIAILNNETSRANKLMSAAVPNNPYNFKGYDATIISRYLNFMTVMAYDFHVFIAKGDNRTGYNSPLYTPKGESATMSTSGIINYFLGLGIPASKMLMGIPLYGHSWTLASESQHDLHAPAIGKGGPSPYRHLKGIYVFPDVCAALQSGAKNVLDNTNVATYLYFNTTWVAYDNPITVTIKVAWVKSQNLGGVGIWAMNLDDTTGVCNLGSLPLLTTIKSNL